MSGKYVIIHRSFDPIQAEFLGDILRDNGISARVLGTRNGAGVGVAQNIMELHIEVPVSQAGAATDFVESFVQEDGAELLRAQGLLGEDEDEDADDGGAEAPQVDDAVVGERRPLLAAGSVLLMFGGAHLYARRSMTTAVIAAVQVLALWHMVSAEWKEVATGISLFGAMLLFDLIGGQFAARSYNRGDRWSPLRQLLTGTVVAAAAFALAAQLGSRIPKPKSQRSDGAPIPAQADYALP